MDTVITIRFYARNKAKATREEIERDYTTASIDLRSHNYLVIRVLEDTPGTLSLMKYLFNLITMGSGDYFNFYKVSSGSRGGTT